MLASVSSVSGRSSGQSSQRGEVTRSASRIKAFLAQKYHGVMASETWLQEFRQRMSDFPTRSGERQAEAVSVKIRPLWGAFIANTRPKHTD
jgi:hypothetical protein